MKLNTSFKAPAPESTPRVPVAALGVAQVSKPAVSPISKSAGRPAFRGASGFGNPRHSRLGSLRYVSVAASSERGSVSRSASAPKGRKVNSRGCQPTVIHANATRPRRGRTIPCPTIGSTLSGSGMISGTCPVGWHPRLFTLNPFGIPTLAETRRHCIFFT